MKSLGIAACSIALLAVASARAPAQQLLGHPANQPMMAQLNQVIQDWPEGPREEMGKLIDIYGMPSGLTNNRAIWDDPAGPFNEITVRRETFDHNWPAPHQDYLEQTIFYSVPEDKFDELATFDGSIIAERTRGTLAARCHTEWANLIALNLAHDVITERKTVQEARDAYADAVRQKMGGQTPEIASRLLFEPMTEEQARNPAERVISPMN